MIRKQVNKRLVFNLLVVMLVAAFIWLAGLIFPKYVIRLIGFGVFILLDLLCLPIFLGFSRKSFSMGKRMSVILYLLPVILFIIFIILSGIWPMQHWPAFPRIYYPGLLILLFVWKFMLLMGIFLSELYYLPGNLIYWSRALMGGSGHDWKRSSFFIQLGFYTGGLCSILTLSGFFFWVYSFQVRTVEIPIKGLPGTFDGFRIVQLSDIHLGSWISEKPLHRAIDLTMQQDPDVIVFTGDLVNYTTDEAYPFRRSLGLLKAPLGIYTILGNHDYGEYVKWDTPALKEKNNQDLADFYSGLNWTLLNNQHAIIRKGGDSIVILGIENWSNKKLWGQRGKLGEAIEGVQDVPVQVLLSHDPTSWRSLVLNHYPGIKLTLSGHTHAMQMGWETGKFRWSPAALLFPEWAGLYQETRKDGNTRYLYVNRGLGHLGIPGRIGIRPEITVLVLRKD